jgi:hypothetical protein
LTGCQSKTIAKQGNQQGVDGNNRERVMVFELAQLSSARERAMAHLAPRKKEETRMKLTKNNWFRVAKWMGTGLIGTAMAWMALAQPISTTTVQGTLYLADGTPGSGTVQVTWPAFTTASNQAVLAGRTTITVGADGFLNVNLAPNLGASPAGLYYTATYHMSDGTTNTEYSEFSAALLFNLPLGM